MAVRVRCITDPACVWSWALEPAVRALMVEFGDELQWTFVMGGLAREFESEGLVPHWLDAAAESGMPTDPRAWYEGPIRSSYPACMAVKAAQEQGPDLAARYLRALREGIVALRRKLDTREALVEEARGVGLDVERFRIDLGSHAIVEGFGGDLEESREVPDVVREADKVRCSASVGEERVPFPTFRFEGDGVHWTCGFRPHSALREAALAAGARPSDRPRPDVMGALDGFGRMAVPEVAAVCDLPALRAEVELARLALDWRVRPVPVGCGRLWEPA
ncbi:MAG TPA: DsbA family protein [Thermoleophilaceae bacterium]|nr:DsbA family protein [Thermoleophilaceae bacterium]